MERDFMGLNYKEPLPVVKEEIHDGSGSSGMQWPFLNKVSAHAHFATPKLAQEDCGKRIIGSDPHMSSGFMTISAADAYELSHKLSVVEIQKALDHVRHAGTHFSMAAYSAQHDAPSMRRSHLDAKAATIPNQTVASPISNAFFKAHLAATGQTVARGNMKQQLVGGIPAMTPHSILPAAGSAGVTEQWRNRFNANGAPAQMTIFYAGTVNVYNEMSPEKAQAIMLLAGNQYAAASNAAHSLPAPTLKPTAAGDAAHASQPPNTPPSSAHSSPTSVTSLPAHQSGNNRCTNNEELIAAKSAGVSATTPVATKPMMSSAVPLARKASLARFLEKRKERAMNVAPYNLDKGGQECGTASKSGGLCPHAAAPHASSVPLSAGKEISLGN